jgi:hypothetical protein
VETRSRGNSKVAIYQGVSCMSCLSNIFKLLKRNNSNSKPCSNSCQESSTQLKPEVLFLPPLLALVLGNGIVSLQPEAPNSNSSNPAIEISIRFELGNKFWQKDNEQEK